ncbi:MAG: hypothetical protein PHS49_04235 [Candidatus Gracilibacteria bacterium]|nr:hypothetical protein [Candidatus Gracilibacteria bacterium]
MEKSGIIELDNQSITNKIIDNIDNEEKASKPLFTKSRILFLICVFLVMLMPLLYRQFEYLLK